MINQEGGCNVLHVIDSTEEDKILADGVSRFCDDLKLDPASVTVLIIAWKFQVLIR